MEVVNVPHSTLPSAEAIRVAISSWFRGGPSTNLLVNVLRREQATLSESADVAQRLSRSMADGYLHVITDQIVAGSLETTRAVGQVNQTKEGEEARSPNPPIGGVEWHRRATERAKRNEWAENPWRTWTWEKPAKQRRGA